MEEIYNKWGALSITTDEEKVFHLDESVLKENRREIGACLVGKLLTEKSFNKNVFKKFIANRWDIKGGLEIKDLDDGGFLFQFHKELERKRILENEPWLFDKSLLLLREVREDEEANCNELRAAKFWIHFHGLPLSLVSPRMGLALGNQVGTCLSVDTDKAGRCKDNFIRARVLIDTEKPLRRGVNVRLGEMQGTKMIGIRFEKLPDFCFSCGLMGHTWKVCKSRVSATENDQTKHGYGDWLRGETPNRWAGPFKFPAKATSSRNGGPPLVDSGSAKTRSSTANGDSKEESIPEENPNRRTHPFIEVSMGNKRVVNDTAPVNAAVEMSRSGIHVASEEGEVNSGSHSAREEESFGPHLKDVADKAQNPNNTNQMVNHPQMSDTLEKHGPIPPIIGGPGM